MASVALGFFLGGCVVAIPVVTGIAEGVEHQKKQNEEAQNETRMVKFNALVTCDTKDEFADEINNGILVVRHDKVCPPPPLLPPPRSANTTPLALDPLPNP
jgi:hypothetical protein